MKISFISTGLIVTLLFAGGVTSAQATDSTSLEQAPSTSIISDTTAEKGLALAERLSESPSTSAYENLSATEKAALEAVVVPVEYEIVEETGQPLGTFTARAKTGCWDHWAIGKAKAAAGNTIFTWWQGLKWCAKNGKITSHSVYDRGGETSTPGWSYKGNGGKGSRIVGSQVRQYTQQKFTFGIGNYGYTDTRCIQIRGGLGKQSTRLNCSLA